MQNSTYARRLSETYSNATCSLGTLKNHRFNKLKNFLEAQVCVLYVSNKFHRRYRRVEYALDAFGARCMRASVRYMRVPFLRDIASVTCPKRVLNARLTFGARV